MTPEEVEQAHDQEVGDSWVWHEYTDWCSIRVLLWSIRVDQYVQRLNKAVDLYTRFQFKKLFGR